MPRFTKGPWSRNIKPARKYNTIFAGRNTHVCHLTVTGLTDEEIEGNCDLIKAAPELYDALKEALALFDKDHALDHFDWGASVLRAEDIRELNELPGKIRAALARADGARP